MQLGNYFADHSRRAFEMMAGRTGDPAVDKIWRWIKSRGDSGQDFSRQELWRNVKGGRFLIAKDIDPPLERLREAGRIARRPIASKGRERVPQVWAVNPQGLKEGIHTPRGTTPITPVCRSQGYPKGQIGAIGVAGVGS